MATGTVYVDASIKDFRTGNVLVFGRLLMGQNATVNPRDVNLRTLIAIGLTPWLQGNISQGASDPVSRRFIVAAGSIGSQFTLDTSTGGAPLGAYARVHASRFYGTNTGGDHVGTWRMSTLAGSARLSFWAVGR